MKKRLLYSVLFALFILILSPGLPEVQAAKAKKITLKATNGTTVYVGGASKYRTTSLNVTVKPKNASKNVKFKSSNTKVAKVNSKGKVTGKKQGKAKITVTSKKDSKVKKSITVTVKKYSKRIRPSSVTAKTAKTSLKSGEKTKVTYSVKPNNTTNKNIKFQSLNTSLVSVNSKGDVTANTAGRTGTAKIRVIASDTNKKNKQVYKDVSVTILPVEVTSVTCTVRNLSMKVGDNASLQANVSPANATNKNITWSSSDTGKLAVSQKGVLTAYREGTVTVTAKSHNSKTAQVQVEIKTDENSGETPPPEEKDIQRVTVHDPSIMKDRDGTYYVFGTHLAAAKSTDLLNWDDSVGGMQLFGCETEDDFKNKLAPVFNWLNSNSTGVGNIWASQVIYNRKNGRYYYYASASLFGVTNSMIWYSTSENIDGPYSDPQPIIYSGFNNNESASNRLSYKNTNIPSLIEDRKISGVNSNWFSNNSYNGSEGKYPNAIDPAVFYDKDGRLWMVYGSYFGGIYILELDEDTGEPIYPGTDDANTDRYFGKLILNAAGNGSGEGPYVIYDAVSDYYYLFNTYGGLAVGGGYNLRVFRSKNPDGPYEDAAGNTGTDAVNKGVKLFDNYQFSGIDPAYVSGGHSSALIDDDGKMFKVYHTRFADENKDHQVRNHQMFINKEGWPVVLPYEYKGETIRETGYTMAEMAGSYEFINHGNTTISIDDVGEIYDIIGGDSMIHLRENGTIDGAVNGTWTVEPMTPFVTMNIGGTDYKGVFCLQLDETDKRNEVMTFSALGDNNISIWGSKTTLSEDHLKTFFNLSKQFVGGIKKDLPVHDGNAQITWTSEDTKLIGNNGAVYRDEESRETRVTASVTINGITAEKVYHVLVKAKTILNEDGLIAAYDFNDSAEPEADISGNGLHADLKQTSYRTDWDGRSGVLQFTGASNSYVQLPKELVNTENFTFAAWVNSSASEWWERIIDLGDSAGNSIFLTSRGTNLNGAGVFKFDYTKGSSNQVICDSTLLAADTWKHVAFTISDDGSAVLYLDGEIIGSLNAGSIKNTLSDFKGEQNYLGKSQYTVDPLFKGFMDDVYFYGRILSQSEIQALMQKES